MGEVETNQAVSDRVTQKLEDEERGLDKRRQQAKKEWCSKPEAAAYSNSDSDSDSDCSYSSDEDGGSSDKNKKRGGKKKKAASSSGGGGCWLDQFKPKDTVDSDESSDDEDLEGGWLAVTSPRKGGVANGSFTCNSSDSKGKGKGKGSGSGDSEWQDLLEAEKVARAKVAKRKAAKKKKEEEGLNSRMEKLKKRDEAMGVGPRHCLVAVPDLAALTKAFAPQKEKKTKANKSMNGQVVEVDDANPLLYSNQSGEKKKKKSKDVEQDPMLVTHLATADGYGEVTNKKKKVKIPATAFALEKVWARQYRREPALFHELLFSGKMDEENLKVVFSGLNDPTIVSEAIVGMDKYLNSASLATETVVRSSFTLLQALTKSGRFMTTVMMLSDSDKKALERVFGHLEGKQCEDFDLEKIKSQYTK